jgi:hypothetical protein
MDGKLGFGLTGAWMIFGLQTDKYDESIFHPYSGGLDAPEVLVVGGMRQCVLPNGRVFASPMISIRGDY